MGGSDNSNPMPWAGLFYGREAELGELLAAYRRIEGGAGPEILVILGESGLGKTRLVQEFYARLSSQIDDPGCEGYWPDQLVRDANNLKINPEPTECNTRQLAEMRFLWWGIRMLDRSGHNAGLGGLSESVSLLRAHLEPFARARLLSSRIRDAAKSASIDIAIEIGNLFTFGLLGLGKLGLDHAGEWKAIADEKNLLAGMDPGSEHSRQRDSLVDIVLADLEALFASGRDKGKRLPAIILLDDAQWLAGDETTLAFVARLVNRARQANWPLLIVATHWEREWHEQHEADGKESLAGIAGPCAQVLRLGKEPDLAGMIKAGFPGISARQRQVLLDKADGNPRLLDEMLRYLQRKRGMFEQRDPERGLTQRGEREIAEREFGIHDLVADRLAEAADNVRAALGMAALQGGRFLDRLTFLAAEQIEEPGIGDGLRMAELPHCMIARVAEAVHEFSQGIYREAALEQLSDILDEDRAGDALVQAAIDLAGSEQDFPDLTEEEQETAWLVVPELFQRLPALTADQYSLVLRCYRQAADAADARHAFSQTCAVLQRAGQFVERQANRPPLGSARDLSQLARLASRLRILPVITALRAAIEELLPALETAGGYEAEIEDLLLVRVKSAQKEGDPHHTIAMLTRFLDWVGRGGRQQFNAEQLSAEAIFRADLGYYQALASESEAASETITQVLETIAEIPDDNAKVPGHKLAAYRSCASAYCTLREFRAALACCDLAEKELEKPGIALSEAGRLGAQAMVNSIRSVAHARDGQLERSIECDEATLSSYRALGEIHPSYTARLNLLSVAKRLAGKTGKIGSYERSYELLRECLSLARDLVDSMPTRINRLTEASVDLEAGKHLAMRRSHKNALKFFDRAIRSLWALYDEQPDLRSAELLAAALNHSAGSNARLRRFVPAIATRRSALALLEEWQSHWSETDNTRELIELQRASIAALEQKSDEQDNA